MDDNNPNDSEREYAEYISQGGASFNFTCPICGSDKAFVNQRLLQIPYYDDFHAVIFLCPDCGMRRADFANLDSKGATRYSYHIEGMEDFTTKVVRAIEGVVKIPEIGLAIHPATAPSSWIRNIEGILLDIKEKVEIARNQAEDENTEQRAIELLATLDQMMRGEVPFTIVVEDPSGNSVIIPAVEEKLFKEPYTPQGDDGEFST